MDRFNGFGIKLFLDEEGDWLAHFVEMPHISAFSDTPGGALKELETAWEGIKEVYNKDNEPIPKPASQPYQEGENIKPCNNRDCPGQYENKTVPYVFRHKGKIIVFDNIPAEVCSVCGDTLISLDTSEAIEKALNSPESPKTTAPVYSIPEAKAA